MRAMRLIVLAMMVVLRVAMASAQTQATPSPDAVAAAKELM
jgi:hypothetical protein